MRPKRLALVALLLGAAACVRSAGRPVDAEVTFATRPEHGGFTIDRLHDGATGVLTPRGWFRMPDAPTFVLRSDGEDRAALWLVGRSRVLVRSERSTIAPRTGEVLSTWDDGAIRLDLWSRDGSTLRTDTFVRDGDGSRPATLGRAAGARTDLRGTYRATVRDGQGAAVGWIRVRIGRDGDAARAYDARLPAGVEDGLAAAAAVALDREIGWIEEHVADDSPDAAGVPAGPSMRR